MGADADADESDEEVDRYVDGAGRTIHVIRDVPRWVGRTVGDARKDIPLGSCHDVVRVAWFL